MSRRSRADTRAVLVVQFRLYGRRSAPLRNGAGLLNPRVAATQLGLDQAEQFGKLDVPRYFPNIGKPDVFNLSTVLVSLPGNQRHADENALLTIVQTHCDQL